MTNRMSILLLLLSFNSFAQQGSSTISVPLPSQAAKNWSIGIGSTLETDSKTTGNVEKTYSNTTDLALVYNFPFEIKSTLALSMGKELTGSREETLGDPSLSLSKPIGNIGKYIKTTGVLTTVAPLSESSKKTTSLQTLAATSVAFVYDGSTHITSGLTLIYIPTVTRYFHEFDQQTSGKSNSQTKLQNRLKISYAITDSVAILLDNIYSRSTSYRGNSKDAFAFDQSVSYSHESGASVSLGHSIGGSALADNGVESNVRLFDAEDSTYYLSLGFEI